MIVLSEDSPARQQSISARENHAATEIARLLGFRAYYIPADFTECGDAEGALAFVPSQEQPVPGIWIGFIPAPARYGAVYDAAFRRNIRLLNSPEEHLRAQEFDRSYPYLVDLTPRSMVLTDLSEVAQAIETIGLPAFVKGTVQSRKVRGWKACVAETADELGQLVATCLTLEGRTRGRVIVRELVRLRHAQRSPEGFPFGREYRVFLYRDRVLAHGYYWEGDDPLKQLDTVEQGVVLDLAREAARRLNVPYVAIDIGQLEDGRWIVIESGDGQFAGLSEIPPMHLWVGLWDVCQNLAVQGGQS